MKFRLPFKISRVGAYCKSKSPDSFRSKIVQENELLNENICQVKHNSTLCTVTKNIPVSKVYTSKIPLPITRKLHTASRKRSRKKNDEDLENDEKTTEINQSTANDCEQSLVLTPIKPPEINITKQLYYDYEVNMKHRYCPDTDTYKPPKIDIFKNYTVQKKKLPKLLVKLQSPKPKSAGKSRNSKKRYQPSECINEKLELENNENTSANMQSTDRNYDSSSKKYYDEDDIDADDVELDIEPIELSEYPTNKKRKRFNSKLTVPKRKFDFSSQTRNYPVKTEKEPPIPRMDEIVGFKSEPIKLRPLIPSNIPKIEVRPPTYTPSIKPIKIKYDKSINRNYDKMEEKEVMSMRMDNILGIKNEPKKLPPILSSKNIPNQEVIQETEYNNEVENNNNIQCNKKQAMHSPRTVQFRNEPKLLSRSQRRSPRYKNCLNNSPNFLPAKRNYCLPRRSTYYKFIDKQTLECGTDQLIQPIKIQILSKSKIPKRTISKIEPQKDFPLLAYNIVKLENKNSASNPNWMHCSDEFSELILNKQNNSDSNTKRVSDIEDTIGQDKNVIDEYSSKSQRNEENYSAVTNPDNNMNLNSLVNKSGDYFMSKPEEKDSSKIGGNEVEPINCVSTEKKKYILEEDLQGQCKKLKYHKQDATISPESYRIKEVCRYENYVREIGDKRKTAIPEYKYIDEKQLLISKIDSSGRKEVNNYKFVYRGFTMGSDQHNKQSITYKVSREGGSKLERCEIRTCQNREMKPEHVNNGESNVGFNKINICEMKRMNRNDKNASELNINSWKSRGCKRKEINTKVNSFSDLNKKYRKLQTSESIKVNPDLSNQKTEPKAKNFYKHQFYENKETKPKMSNNGEFKEEFRKYQTYGNTNLKSGIKHFPGKPQTSHEMNRSSPKTFNVHETNSEFSKMKSRESNDINIRKTKLYVPKTEFQKSKILEHKETKPKLNNFNEYENKPKLSSIDEFVAEFNKYKTCVKMSINNNYKMETASNETSNDVKNIICPIFEYNENKSITSKVNNIASRIKSTIDEIDSLRSHHTIHELKSKTCMLSTNENKNMSRLNSTDCRVSSKHHRESSPFGLNNIYKLKTKPGSMQLNETTILPKDYSDLNGVVGYKQNNLEKAALKENNKNELEDNSDMFQIYKKKKPFLLETKLGNENISNKKPAILVPSTQIHTLSENKIETFSSNDIQKCAFNPSGIAPKLIPPKRKYEPYSFKEYSPSFLKNTHDEPLESNVPLRAPNLKPVKRKFNLLVTKLRHGLFHNSDMASSNMDEVSNKKNSKIQLKPPVVKTFSQFENSANMQFSRPTSKPVNKCCNNNYDDIPLHMNMENISSSKTTALQKEVKKYILSYNRATIRPKFVKPNEDDYRYTKDAFVYGLK